MIKFLKMKIARCLAKYWQKSLPILVSDVNVLREGY